MRRLSGGGAVYHDNGNLNFSFIRNREKSKFPLGTDFLKPVVKLLNGIGIPVETGKRKDLWLDGFKVSGTASHIGKDRVMHHGTLLYDTNIENLKHSLAAELPDCFNEGLHGGGIFFDNLSEISQKSVSSISSVPSPVRNIRTYLKEKGMDAPVSKEFFRKLKLIFLTENSLNELTNFASEEIAQIETLQEKIYQKYTWIYKK